MENKIFNDHIDIEKKDLFKFNNKFNYRDKLSSKIRNESNRAIKKYIEDKSNGYNIIIFSFYDLSGMGSLRDFNQNKEKCGFIEKIIVNDGYDIFEVQEKIRKMFKSIKYNEDSSNCIIEFKNIFRMNEKGEIESE